MNNNPNRAVVLNELNAEIADGTPTLTLSDLQPFGVDREASLAENPALVIFTDGSAIHLNGTTGWWTPGRGQW